MIGNKITRRGFICQIAAFLFGVIVVRALRLPSAAQARSRSGRSRVVSVTHPGASSAGPGLDNADLDGDIVRRMVHEGILAFTGEKDLKDAWKKIIPDPSLKVAIKVNCQVRGIYTKAKVVQPLVEGLLASGVSGEHIIIYDMTDTAFDLAGFTRNVGHGVKVGTVADFGGYSRFLFHRLANLLAGGYEHSVQNLCARLERESRSEVLRFVARLLLKGRRRPWNCEYLINVPVLKALDGYSGVTLSMKNHYGSIGNPADHHDDIMDYIPEVNDLPEIKEKTRLVVLDALFGEYKWINGREQQYVERVNKISFSDDPVAIDAVGWRMIEGMRKTHGLPPLSPQPEFIAKAVRLGLGNGDASRIEELDLQLSG